MKVFQKRTVYIWCALLLLLAAGNGYAQEALLPKNLTIEKDFQPGNGLSVGLVQVVEGRVVIMHADMLRGYLAKKDLPLFQGDIVVTPKDGRARLAMNDGSILSMAPDTRMVINQSVYHKKKKRRFSFFKLLGKARFLVKKIVNLRQSDVKIKTQTAVVGVRGSDFVIEGTPATTVVTAFDLEGAQLETVSLAEPEAKPTILSSNQRSEVRQGAPPTKPVFVPSPEREEMKKGFIPIPGPGEPIERPDLGKPGAPLKPVFFAYDELILDLGGEIEEPEAPEPRDLDITRFFEEREDMEKYEDILDIKTEEIEPSVQIQELPSFPETPF